MRSNYFIAMLFVGFVLLIALVFFLDKWIAEKCTQVVHYFLTQRGLLAPMVLVTEASLGLGVLAYWAMALFRKNYNPQGTGASQTHEWVFQDTGRKFRDVMEYEIYERQHGPGSWQKKVEQERRGFIWVGALVAVLLEVGLLALGGAFSGGALPWGILALGAGYFLSAGLHQFCNYLSDTFEFEETLWGDLMISLTACLYLALFFLVLHFIYLLVFFFLPNAPEWMRAVYLGSHGAFVIFLVLLAALFPFMPVYMQIKGLR